MSINLSNIAILNVNGVHYRCIINRISKSEVVNFLQKADLKKKRLNIKYNLKHKNLLSHKKMGKEILTFGDNEIENKFYCLKNNIF